MSTFKQSTATMFQLLNRDEKANWANEKALLLQRIQFLEEQRDEYMKREEDNKKINDIMKEILKNLDRNDLREKETHLRILNNQLQDELSRTKSMHTEIVQHYEDQLRSLKDDIFHKDRQIMELERDFNNQIMASKSKIDRLEVENSDLHRRFQQLTLQSTSRRNESGQKEALLAVLGGSYQQTTRRDMGKIQQLRNVSSIQSRINSSADVLKSSTDIDIENNMNETNVRKKRVQSYMKKDKNQIRMMVTTLLKAKEKLEEGYQNVTYVAERPSISRPLTKASKSFYN